VTHISCHVIGAGAPMLLLHGAAEDADLLRPQAEAFAARGHRVITYDRRGTGDSSRAGWPDGGVATHVADAARLITDVAGGPTRVLGFSSGGVLALALAETHPELVRDMIAWEPPALAVLPDGLALHAQMLQPIDEYLQEHPGDWSGAYDVMLMIMSGGAAELADGRVERMRRNAEAALRDDGPIITAHRLHPSAGAADVTVATGPSPDALLGQIAAVLADEFGTTVRLVPDADDHEIYLSRPEVLVEAFCCAPERALA
jgi:pimeloyl-ACP methyl ester carboxylesterase